MLINQELAELEYKWGFSPEQLKHIRYIIATYALAAVHDTAIQEECLDVLEEDLTGS